MAEINQTMPMTVVDQTDMVHHGTLGTCSA
jgi:hypothetical protein